jgi:hypothetical protein
VVPLEIGAAKLAVAKGETVAAPRRIVARPDTKPRATRSSAREILLLPAPEGL